MRRPLFVLLLALSAACAPKTQPATGVSSPDLGWLFLDKGPYTLTTHVDAAPGPATFQLVRDLSLMADTPDVVFSTTTEVSPDSMLTVKLGQIEPGFYQVRLRDTVRWNIGFRPDQVVSPPDAPADFDAFWTQTLEALEQVPLEPVLTEVPEYSNALRTTYQVRYASLDGAIAGGVLCVPNAPGKYPVVINYMGYGADVYYYDPSSAPDRIEFLVSVRDQGIFKEGQERWIDRGIDAKEQFYYRGAFCDVKRAVDFAASYEKADPERMVAWGESQGGAFTFVAAALDSRIKAIAPAVPFLGDYADYARIVWWPVHEVFETADAQGLPREQLLEMLRYFDVKNFAPRITCPVYMSFGLQDPTCPPHTNFSIYNNLGTKDKRFYCVPTCGHAMWQEPSWTAERTAFLDRYLGAAGALEADASAFVNVTDVVPDAILEIRYFGTYNFVGARVDGYLEPVALMTRAGAEHLKAVSDDVKAQGYRLKIYDAYRPQCAVDHFCRWGADLKATEMKPCFYPNEDKAHLFERGYIAEKSGHSRGSTLDLTLFDMATGKELDMGGVHDWFGPESHPDYCGNPDTDQYIPVEGGITEQQFHNRQILRRAMLRHGFKPYDCEWWHFTLENEPFPNTYFTFPNKTLQRP